MKLYCVQCAIFQQGDENIREAMFIINGQSVCHDHVDEVTAEPGTSAVLIAKGAKP